MQKDFILLFRHIISWPWLATRLQGTKNFWPFSSCIIKIIKIYVCHKRVLRMMGKFFLTLWWFSFLRSVFYCLENFYDTFYAIVALKASRKMRNKHIYSHKIAMTRRKSIFFNNFIVARLKSTVCRMLFLYIFSFCLIFFAVCFFFGRKSTEFASKP